MSGTKIGWQIELALCIDASASMQQHMERVYEQVTHLYESVKNQLIKMNEWSDSVTVRVRVILFRDYLEDGNQAILLSDFFTLPIQRGEFHSLLGQIRTKGGSWRNNGLEALAYAMKSQWTQSGFKKTRHIIMVWSDKGTHAIGHGKEAKNYPANMPDSFEKLSAWWGSSRCPGVMDRNAKQLVIFAPDYRWWVDIAENWDNVLLYPSEAGKGMDAFTWNELVLIMVQGG